MTENKQSIDVEKLHQFFNKETHKNEERNLVFVWTLIGIAQLDCFSFLKIKDRIYIPFNRPEIVVLDLIELLFRECTNNNIDFSINERKQFVIYNTLFEFYKVYEEKLFIPSQYTFICIDSNAALYDRTQSTEDLIEQMSIESFLNININTNKYIQCRR